MRNLILLATCIAATPLIAAEKIKIQIVEATSVVQMMSVTLPGRPEQISTHCTESANGNTANGDCNTTVIPATNPTPGIRPNFVFSAKAILPDGTHAEI